MNVKATFGLRDGLRDMVVSAGFVEERCRGGAGMVEDEGRTPGCESARTGARMLENDDGDGLDVLG